MEPDEVKADEGVAADLVCSFEFKVMRARLQIYGIPADIPKHRLVGGAKISRSLISSANESLPITLRPKTS